MSVPTSSRLDNFSDIVTYTVMITILFFWGGGGGKLGILGRGGGGEASTPQIP